MVCDRNETSHTNHAFNVLSVRKNHFRKDQRPCKGLHKSRHVQTINLAIPFIFQKIDFKVINNELPCKQLILCFDFTNTSTLSFEFQIHLHAKITLNIHIWKNLIIWFTCSIPKTFNLLHGTIYMKRAFYLSLYVSDIEKKHNQKLVQTIPKGF